MPRGPRPSSALAVACAQEPDEQWAFHSCQFQLAPQDLPDKAACGLLGNELPNACLSIAQCSEVLGRLQCAVIGTPHIDGGDFLAVTQSEPVQGGETRPVCKGGLALCKITRRSREGLRITGRLAHELERHFVHP